MTGVSTDSRSVRPGDLFVALVGPRFDGHDFVGQAVERGAAAVMVNSRRAGALPPGEYAAVAVEETLEGLQRLAAWYRRRLAARVVAVTGSVGKTTTKEMTAAILGRVGPTVRAPASFNNDVGVPLAILMASDETRYLVLEIAMRGLGQIRHLGRLALPSVGVVTNVGESHLGVLGSVEAIARAKAELVEALEAGGAAVLNADDPRVVAMRARARSGVRVITFGTSDAADVRVQHVEGGGLLGTRFELAVRDGPTIPCHVPIPGRHLALDAAAAAAASLACGVDPAAVPAGLAEFAGASMRMETVPGADDVLIINDAYNASPASMRAALETLERIAAERRSRAVAVLGDMLELGELAREAHRSVGEEAARRGVAVLVATGSMAAWTAEGARRAAGGGQVDVVVASDAGEAAARVTGIVRPGDTVLVKGSRAVGLERVVQALASARDAAPGKEVP
ncbi:MAG: UDP-N-acetylmuramoyl-tripeptide--D-alanyl-D-alanine ligase [Limnochordaceae bacterium]|nr:UDP-N-acetylmuramoyl-tripeptide--D-alanyl-D-alanine ligase [Limnochordaceae bacterium]